MRTAGYIAIGAILVVFVVLAIVAMVRSSNREESSSRGSPPGPGSSPGSSVSPGPAGEEFEGDFTLGFEQSSFIPCDKPDLRYWVAWAAGVDLPGRIKQLGITGPYAEVHISFRGTLETGLATGYGHLGRYDGQVTVTEILQIAREGECR